MFDLDNDSIVTLTDEDGVDTDFIMLDVIEYDGSDYMVLLPLEATQEDTTEEDEDEVLILKVEKDAEGEKYLGVDDEATMNAVFDLFKQELDAAMAAEANGEDEE